MYPKTFLDNFWRGSLRREIFVIMPFHRKLAPVWENAIRPAILQLRDDNGEEFQPNCVRQNTPGGDVIREIVDGITNSTLVFADISLLPGERSSAQRNGNVMYELGIANSYREEADIIVVKNDKRKAEFDISPNRYHEYNIDDLPSAKRQFHELLNAGLQTRKGVKQFICEQTWASLDVDCFNFMVRRPPEIPFGHPKVAGEIDALRRLLSLGLVNVEYIPHRGRRHLTWYRFTPFGIAVRNKGLFASKSDVTKFGKLIFGEDFAAD